jgi:hypothetical protein
MSWETLAAAQQLGELQQPVSAAVVGDDVSRLPASWRVSGSIVCMRWSMHR